MFVKLAPAGIPPPRSGSAHQTHGRDFAQARRGHGTFSAVGNISNPMISLGCGHRRNARVRQNLILSSIHWMAQQWTMASWLSLWLRPWGWTADQTVVSSAQMTVKTSRISRPASRISRLASRISRLASRISHTQRPALTRRRLMSQGRLLIGISHRSGPAKNQPVLHSHDPPPPPS